MDKYKDVGRWHHIVRVLAVLRSLMVVNKWVDRLLLLLMVSHLHHNIWVDRLHLLLIVNHLLNLCQEETLKRRQNSNNMDMGLLNQDHHNPCMVRYLLQRWPEGALQHRRTASSTVKLLPDLLNLRMDNEARQGHHDNNMGKALLRPHILVGGRLFHQSHLMVRHTAELFNTTEVDELLHHHQEEEVRHLLPHRDKLLLRTNGVQLHRCR